MSVIELTADQRALETRRGTVKAARNYSVAGIETRAADDAPHIVNFYGHASVTGYGYEMFGGPKEGGWIEFVDPGAFKRTIAAKDEVVFLINHTGMAHARTTSETMTLREDATGLEVKAKLDTRQGPVNDLVIAMERGDMTEMSFAFRIMDQVWLNAEGEEVPWWDMSGIERHIREVSMAKGDVSSVTYGASDATSSSLRSYTDAVRSTWQTHDDLDEGDVRAAIDYLTNLLPTEQRHEAPVDPAAVPMHPSAAKVAAIADGILSSAR